MSVFDFTFHAGKLFPSIIMVLYFGSIVTNAWRGNWQQAVYWSAALLITFSVTWMRFK